MDNFESKFELIDKASATLDAIAKSTSALEGKMTALEGKLVSVEGASAGAADKIKKVGESSSSSSIGLGIITGFVTGLTTKALELASAMASGAFELVKFGISAASTKRDTIAAFQLIEGSADAAATTYERLSKIADKTPFEANDVLKFGKTLRATGFDIRETSDLLAGLFDVGAVQGKEGPEKVKGLLDAILKVRSKDTLNAEVLEAINTNAAAAGVSTLTIAQTIADQRKISLSAARALLLGGTIKGTEGVDLVLATIRRETDKNGPLGQATEVFGKASLDGQLSTLSSRFKQLFQDIKIQPLVDVLSRVNELLSGESPTGKRIKAFIEDTLGSMFRKAGDLLTPENIETALNKATALFENAKVVISGIIDGFGSSFKGLPESIDPFHKSLSDINGAATKGSVNWKEFGSALGDVANALIKIVGLAKDVSELFAHKGAINDYIFNSLNDAADEDAKKDAAARAEAVARASGEGTVKGLLASVPPVKAAAEVLASGVENQTRATLDIHSPSRVMEELGVNTGQGFQIGLDKTPITTGLDSFVAPQLGTGQGFGTSSVEISFGDIIIGGDADGHAPQLVAASVKSEVRTQLISLFEGMGASQ